MNPDYPRKTRCVQRSPLHLVIPLVLCAGTLVLLVSCAIPAHLERTVADIKARMLPDSGTPVQSGVSASALLNRLFLPLVRYDSPVYLPYVKKDVPTPTPTSTPTSTPTHTPTRTPTPTFTPRPVGYPPPYSTSYYLSTTNYDTLYRLGQSVGASILPAQDVIIFLDFGQPWYENGSWGSIIFGSLEFRSISQLTTAVQAFCRGYYINSPTDAHLTLAIGTSNYGRSYEFVSHEHGVAWAQMVNWLNTWIGSPPSWASKIKIAGAIDAEPGWNTAGRTRAWAEGFDSAISSGVYYNFGSCDSCPFAACPTCRILNGWTYEDIWYISWGVRTAFTVPEIYLVSGVNADQWHRVSLYAWNAHGQAIRYSGAMTQYVSCQQKGCTTNTPSQGWLQLFDYLNSDPRTAYTPRWSTDIRW